MPRDSGSGVWVGTSMRFVRDPCRDSDGALDVGAFLGLPLSPIRLFSDRVQRWGATVPTKFISLPQPHNVSLQV